MKRWISYILIIIFGALWFTGCSPEIAKWLYDKEIIRDDYRYGDLYRMSNLPQFRVLKQECPPPVRHKQPLKNVYLFLAGDSFTEPGRIEKEHFDAGKFDRSLMIHPKDIELKGPEKKILVIECVERHFRERFTRPWDHLKVVKDTVESGKGVSMFEFKTFYHERIYSTERHLAVLFSSDFMLAVKELKSLINYRLFGKVDQKVKLTSDGKNILYSLDSDPGISSVFDPVTDEEIDLLVKNVNTTYSDYRKMGFDEVYLSIIPNKTTILGQDLGVYNHLIERVQKHPDLKMPHIDMLGPLMKGGEKLFDKGDTHWNCDGKQIWIDQVNARL